MHGTSSTWYQGIYQQYQQGWTCLFVFSHIYFLASGQAVVTSVVPSFPRYLLAFILYRALGSPIPLLVDFSSSVADSRSRACRKSTCAQEKVPTNLYLYEYALGGIETLETDLYQARGQPDTPPGRPTLVWVGLGWIGLGWVGLGWVGLGWVGLGWVVLGWVDDNYNYPPARVPMKYRVLQSVYWHPTHPNLLC